MSETGDTSSEPQAPTAETPKPIPTSKVWQVLVLLGGVVLPLCALAAELTLRFCSFVYDPIPTRWHIALLLIVPIANLLGLWVFRRGGSRYGVIVYFLLGVSIGVAGVYSFQLAPMLPLSAVALMFAGLGLLGLSPFLALASSIVCVRRLGALQLVEPGKRARSLGTGAVAAIVVLVAYMVVGWVTTIGLNMAISSDEARSRRGVQLIRTFGSKTALLRACYQLPNNVWANVWTSNSWRWEVPREKYRDVYYRVTGDSFNIVPAPRLFGPRARWVEDFEWDSDVGGTAVNSLVRSLSLTSSRMDARIDSDALTAYTEWTMVFTNSSNTEREARAEVALPPGGVVSRLTLWVNGEEREAAFSGRGKVRQAYEQVAVVQRRDPVLVTTCGPDRVLVQCFPVPASGGTMQIRVGITAPLMPDGYSRAYCVLPRFVERNFSLNEQLKHSLMVESDRNMTYDGGSSGFIRALVRDSDLSGAMGTIECSRDPEIGTSWAPDKFGSGDHAVVQTLAESKQECPRWVVVVIDGSKRLADSRGEIAEALKKLPRGCSVAVMQASDETSKDKSFVHGPDRAGEIARSLDRMRFVGGIDNRPALLKAYDMLPEYGESVILWIHGPQPLKSDSYSQQLLQITQRRPGLLRIISVAAAEGRNSILAELEPTGAVTVLPRRGRLQSDLQRLFESWTKPQIVVKRTLVPLGSVTGARARSGHIVRLWARDETLRICETGDTRRTAEASELAARHQIVTAVSGAVVLETQEQYEDAGLKSVDPKSVPTVVPEPSSLLALCAGLGLMGVAVRTPLRRRLCSPEREESG